MAGLYASVTFSQGLGREWGRLPLSVYTHAGGDSLPSSAVVVGPLDTKALSSNSKRVL